MGPLTAALAALLAADIGATAARVKRNAILWSIIGLLLTTAYVFALAATFLYLSAHYSAIAAATAITIALVVTALVLIGILVALQNRDRRRAEERRRRTQMQTNLTLLAAAGILRKQPLLAVATALAIGALVGTGKRRARRREN
ncbi:MULTISPECIES: hypothetical protein [unclassified Ensifer]|uniref:hypothetical protein n=1 Tax=unclassified Ensifer TaxID=2633371 RepID=UPI000813415A|nr:MULTISPECIES: hypothetical protein [unclassified Ensifer]OCP02359.1 hypothetical protein BC362_19040 [Ensifer sp. LC14]OCP14156.1 hypothetical protein BC374_00245 [Ensifer sp. LC13]OCP14833.1 hypothetical protein BBX50_00595 [Ensifer sp. LC11]OCP34319.1 hypothetical protein BC364_00245 [Ensifer sp. LC499]